MLFSRPLTCLSLLTSVLLAMSPSPVAQEDDIMRGRVDGSGAAIKIAVPDPRSTASAADTATRIVEVLRDDLDYSGYFDVVKPTLYSLVPASSSEVRFEDWISIGADQLVRLQVSVDGDRIDLQARLYDNESGTMTVDEKPTAMVVQSSWYCASCHQGPVGQGAPHGEPSI